MTEHISISAREAALWLSFVGMGLFMAGRMGGSWLMGFIRAERLLTYMAAGAILAMILVMLGMGVISVGAFFLFPMRIYYVSHHFRTCHTRCR